MNQDINDNSNNTVYEDPNLFSNQILHSSSSINNDINSWTNFLSNLWITDNNISDSSRSLSVISDISGENDIDHTENIVSNFIQYLITQPTHFSSGEVGTIGNNHIGFSNLFNSRLERSFEEDKTKYKHILTEIGEKEIKIIPFSVDIFKKQKICVISMDEFQEGCQVAQLPCNHIFKPKSILKWLREEKASCPVCRFELDSKEIKI